ncbi:MAG: hypothetical protein EOO61_10100 [Hymenobacter sp.]|nr:MAG: hypothetical protein EOO61_10100 [Hymenobacter sp.]
MATFQLLTPDQHQLTFEKVPKSQLINQIQQGEFILAKDKFPRQVREPVYLNPAGQCLYLYESRNYGHLFATQTDFEQSITGNTYTDSTMLHDKQEQLHCAFELNFDAALPLMSQYIAIDTSYPPSDNYVVYRYADESVCYVAFYSHPIQRQGWWFANLSDFEYFYLRWSS